MIPFDGSANGRTHLFDEMKSLLKLIRALSAQTPATIKEAGAVLREIRSEAAEKLNIFQHEALLLDAYDYLISNGKAPTSADWYWNPHQTGGSSEPDLCALVNGVTTVSAEATASALPKGVIDTRMAMTLAKLAGMEGELFYFVRSPQMLQRAETKVASFVTKIQPVQV